MNKPTSAEGYRAKAERALVSAKVLLTNHDPDGACNRAYYAMFDAVHVALFKCGHGETATRTKTHHGLFMLFSREVMKLGRLPIEIGRSLDQVEQFRLSADYFDGTSTPEQAAWAVERAGIFLEAVFAMPSSD